MVKRVFWGQIGLTYFRKKKLQKQDFCTVHFTPIYFFYILERSFGLSCCPTYYQKKYLAEIVSNLETFVF